MKFRNCAAIALSFFALAGAATTAGRTGTVCLLARILGWTGAIAPHMF